LNIITISSLWIPAHSAELSFSTSVINAPAGVVSLNACASA
jgi:hypothetical protein